MLTLEALTLLVIDRCVLKVHNRLAKQTYVSLIESS